MPDELNRRAFAKHAALLALAAAAAPGCSGDANARAQAARKRTPDPAGEPKLGPGGARGGQVVPGR